MSARFIGMTNGMNGTTPRRLLICPATRPIDPMTVPEASKFIPVDGGLAVASGWKHYGYNSLGAFDGRETFGLARISESAVLVPSNMLAIGDAFMSGPHGTVIEGSASGLGDLLWRTDWDHFFSSLDLQGDTDLARRIRISMTRSPKRHNSRANAVFCDGHVAGLTFHELFIDTSDAALARWNYDNRPHR